MNVYVDSSVLLRVVLGERGVLPQWSKIRRAVSSELVRVECRRTIDRARLRLGLPDEEVVERRTTLEEWLEAFDLVRLDPPILERASEPFPTMLRTPDALHLASALTMRGRVEDLVFATHHAELALAARAVGFRVVGAA